MLGLTKPNLSRLTNWLMAEPGTRPPKRHPSPVEGEWIVVADDSFGKELAADLHAADLKVRVISPTAAGPDLSRAAGVVAGCESDSMNLSIAAHARLANPGVFLSVRQRSSRMNALVEAFSPEALFVATDVVAAETLARLEAPLFWSFIEHLQGLDDVEAGKLLERMTRTLGPASPAAGRIRFVRDEAPAVTSWLRRGHELTLAQLLGSPDDTRRGIAVVPTLLVRGDHTTWLPSGDQCIRPDDQLGFLAGPTGWDQLQQNLFQDSAVAYLATGERISETWLWRLLGRRRASDSSA